ncbi:MBL fold metallo-hydrolase [Nonomuraea lactucae]|uniref:MBL fold metallo-hydrolase n=1 Tax=Nonomuraea lactucae TaxID=2249762 RepID=UPI000DE3930F|nr:MBL fold metallo-hydrolase [Nonomuraea lactucae]
MDSVTLGAVEITRVVEVAVMPFPREAVFPDSDRALWSAHEDWLTPDFWEPGSDVIFTAMQTWVVRSDGRTILIDMGPGNGKERPYVPVFGHLATDFIGNLARAGVRPEDVDTVVCTHLHGDHVGWNTRLAGREWVPTFPNATYLISRTEFDYWNPENGHSTRSGRAMQNVFEDSVAPVHRAGQVKLWDDHHDIDALLRVELAPGHTPGSSIVTLRSGSDRAVFVGDLLHSPVQIAEPDLSPCFDEEESQARDTRRRVLGWAHDNNALVLPAHFPGAAAAEVRRDGGGFAIHEWAAFQ